jgi:hypothetical protein
MSSIFKMLRDPWAVAPRDPVTLAIVAGGAALISAAGAMAQAKQQSDMAKYNARVAEAQGVALKQQAAFEEDKQRAATSRLLSAQQAATGKSGVTFEGSPLLAAATSAANAELDALAIRYSGSIGELRARSQAAQYRAQGKAAMTAGYFKSASSLLSAAGSFGSIGGGGATAGAAVDYGAMPAGPGAGGSW